MRRTFLSVIMVLTVAEAIGQVNIGGQGSASLYRYARTTSPLSENAGVPSFGWDMLLFVDGHVAENVVALGTIEATDASPLDVGVAALRVTDVTPLHLTFQAGKFDLPFGNLGERRYPRNNPLYGLPLIHEYRTGLSEEAQSDGLILAWRGTGYGLRVLNGGMYDVGLMASGSWGIVEVTLAISRGTVSGTSYSTIERHGDIGKLVRVAMTPATGFILGMSYGWGAYMAETPLSRQRGIDVDSYVQTTAGVDVEYSVGHLVATGEGALNSWPVSMPGRKENFRAGGYSLEVKYTVVPRLYIAARFGELRFNSVQLNGISQMWDFPVSSFEGGIGYFIDRNALIKLIRRETRIKGGSHPKDNLTALQLAVSY
jgi:hypothetical protein